MVETPADVSPHATAHEETDVNVRALNTFMIWLVVSLGITAVVVYWQYRLFERQALANDPPPSPRAAERVATPGPVLQINELRDGSQYKAAQAAELEKTAWISREEKLVRIPVEQAVQSVVKNGLPRWPAVPPQSPDQPSP